MVRVTTYAMYVQSSIFLNFLKNEKIVFFDIAYLCLYRVFLCLFFRYRRGKMNNLEIVN